MHLGDLEVKVKPKPHLLLIPFSLVLKQVLEPSFMSRSMISLSRNGPSFENIIKIDHS